MCHVFARKLSSFDGLTQNQENTRKTSKTANQIKIISKKGMFSTTKRLFQVECRKKGIFSTRPSLISLKIGKVRVFSKK
jgi:hypothetical protein